MQFGLPNGEDIEKAGVYLHLYQISSTSSKIPAKLLPLQASKPKSTWKKFWFRTTQNGIEYSKEPPAYDADSNQSSEKLQNTLGTENEESIRSSTKGTMRGLWGMGHVAHNSSFSPPTQTNH